MQTEHRLSPPEVAGSADWRRALWIGLLVAASVLFTLRFACAVPFAAFGAVAALTMPRRQTLFLTLAIWLANQIVGFAILGYPWTANTFAWGFVLGLSAVLATLAAQWIAPRLEGRSLLLILPVTFLGAFAAYEGSLYLAAVTALGGTDVFVSPIMLGILKINAIAFAGLLAVNRLGALIGLTADPTTRHLMAARHA